jgi:23S rRNA (guanosine2251-2'-O)-methyltransferase
VRELLRAGTREVREVVIASGTATAARPGESSRGRSGGAPAEAAHAPLAEIAELARARRVRVRVVDPPELDRIAATESPQGVLARAAPLRAADLDTLLAAPGVPFLVLFDGVTDPGNLGSVLRTALCAGATGAVLPSHRTARVSPATAKAAAGAIEHLPIAVVPGIPAALEQLRRAQVWSVGLDPRGGREVDSLEILTEPLALVLGAEGRGLGPLARRRCDALAKISLHGPLDSINVAAAAAVACFAVSRKRAE